MKTRVAIVAALLTAALVACTVQRYPGDCVVAPPDITRVKNKAFGYTPSTVESRGAAC
jgi:hypothetical protein